MTRVGIIFRYRVITNRTASKREQGMVDHGGLVAMHEIHVHQVNQ
jgi:hypothetical protein